MADSQAYRKKFLTGNIIFSSTCLVILIFVYMLAGTLSSGKIDMTADEIYTLSDPTKEIMSELVDKVRVDYYVSSENLPAHFETIVRDTRDMFKEFHEISGGKFEYHIVDPDELASEYAAEKTDEYFKIKAEGGTPKEPEPIRSIQDIFSGRQGPTEEEIKAQREKMAQARAAAQARPKEKVLRELLMEEFEQQYKQKLEQDQIGSFPITETEAGSVRQVRVYSSIKISYLDKTPEVIPVHWQIESLEYELVSRIIKLTTDAKPVVAFFDPLKPDAPPPNPMNPMQQPPPMSDYAGIIGALQEFFDIREISLKKDDSIDDLLVKLKEEKWDRDNEDATEEKKEQELDRTIKPEDFRLLKTLIVVQPDNLESRQVFEINRAVSMGVPGVILASRNSLDISRQGLQNGLPILSLNPGADFEDLLKKWGLDLRRELIASNDCGIIEIPRRMGPLMVNAPMPITACVMASRTGIDQTHALTNRIQGLVFPMTTGFTVTKSAMDSASLESDVLARCSDRSWTVSIDPFRNMNNPMMRGQGPTLAQYQKELAEQKPPDSLDFVDPVPLALLVRGKFPFKYQGQAIPEWKPEEPSDGPPGGGFPGMPGGFPGMPGGIPGHGDGDAALNADDPEIGEFVDVAMAQDADAAEEEVDAAEEEVDAAEEEVDAAEEEVDVAEEEVDVAEEEAPEEKPEPLPTASLEPVPGKVLFLASADMMKTAFLSQRGGDYQSNINFFYNAIENFGLGDRLIQIRRKQLTARNFEHGSEDYYKYIMALNLVVVPLLVVLAGVVLFLMRRAKGVAYERNYLQRHGHVKS